MPPTSKTNTNRATKNKEHQDTEEEHTEQADEDDDKDGPEHLEDIQRAEVPDVDAHTTKPDEHDKKVRLEQRGAGKNDVRKGKDEQGEGEKDPGDLEEIQRAEEPNEDTHEAKAEEHDEKHLEKRGEQELAEEAVDQERCGGPSHAREERKLKQQPAGPKAGGPRSLQRPPPCCSLSASRPSRERRRCTSR